MFPPQHDCGFRAYVRSRTDNEPVDAYVICNQWAGRLACCMLHGVDLPELIVSLDAELQIEYD